jgi:hypothetical protein
VRGVETRKVQVHSPCAAVPHLHGREVPPALMIKQGCRLFIGRLAVDRYVSYLIVHRRRLLPRLRLDHCRQQASVHVIHVAGYRHLVGDRLSPQHAFHVSAHSALRVEDGCVGE